MKRLITQLGLIVVSAIAAFPLTLYIHNGNKVTLQLALQPAVAQATASQGVTEAKVRAALPEIEKLANGLMEKTGMPGMAIAVVYQDQVLYLKGFGVREAGKPEQVDPDTVFQIASMSKPIASTVVAGVVGDKVVQWNDPIIKHDPDFQLDGSFVTQEVTLLDLFSHRSGLPEHAGDDLEDLGFDRATILHRLRYLAIGNNFRSRYAYTNFGLTEAAVAVAKAAGKPWEVLSAERLYQPLGMRNTSSRYADFASAQNRASGHVSIDNKWVAKYQRQPDAQSPAGGVSSTVRDLSQWLRLQLGNGKFEGRQLINVDALALTHFPQVVSRLPQNPSDRAGYYGLGWNVSYTNEGLVELSHSGAFSLGAATTVYLLPSESLGIVVLTNAYPIGLPESVALSFLDLARYGKVERDYFELLKPIFAEMVKPPYGNLVDYSKPPTQRLPALPASAYVGHYYNDYVGKIEIATQGDNLILLLGPNQTAFPLQHYNHNVFAYQPVGENAGGLSGVTFTVAADGKATDVTIENLNLFNQGTLQRVQSQN